MPSIFASGLSFPFDLAFDRSGNLFESDEGSGHIYKFTTNGVQLTFASGLSNPVGLAFDSAGNLFVTDTHIGDIYKFTTNGVQTTFASGLSSPFGLAFDSQGNIFEADNGTGQINEFKKYVDGTVNSTPVVFATGLGAPTLFAFQFAPPPPLNIASAGNQVVIYWPAWAANYTLQTSTNMSSPNWVRVVEGTSIVGVTVTNSSPAAFFRLQAP